MRATRRRSCHTCNGSAASVRYAGSAPTQVIGDGESALVGRDSGGRVSVARGVHRHGDQPGVPQGASAPCRRARPRRSDRHVDVDHGRLAMYLITGAGGGIGSVSRGVVELLLDDGQQVRAMVRRDDDRADGTSRNRRRSRRRRSDQPAGRRERDGRRRPDVLQHERLAGLPDGDVHRLRGRARSGPRRGHREHVADDRVADDADQHRGIQSAPAALAGRDTS